MLPHSIGFCRVKRDVGVHQVQEFLVFKTSEETWVSLRFPALPCWFARVWLHQRIPAMEGHSSAEEGSLTAQRTSQEVECIIG